MPKKRKPADVRVDEQVEWVKGLGPGVTTAELIEAANAVAKQAEKALKEDGKFAREIGRLLGKEGEI
jgi:hypothetical protein